MNKKVAGIIAGGITIVGGGGAIIVDQQINPYDTVGTKLEIVKESTLSDAGEVKNIVSTDEPKITLQKWNGEVALGVKSMDLPPTTTGSRPFLSKNVEWNSGDVKMEAVPLDPSPEIEDGGMEINIILNSVPSSNVFTFQLDNWENLDFFLQKPLWEEAGLKAPIKDCTDTDCTTAEGTSHRPPEVVGSYAVYYKDHSNHKVGSTNYATGKAYHIFRPLVTDNSGNTTWADLSYDNGVLTVTVPQDFLDSASYPVKVDPTFGYTTVGGTGIGGFLSALSPPIGQLHEPLTVGSASTATKISIYTFCGTGTGTDEGMTTAIYTFVSGFPDSLQTITKQNVIEVGTSGSWIDTNTFSLAMSAGMSYTTAVGFVPNPVSGGCNTNGTGLYRDTTSGSQRSNHNTAGDLPTTWVNAGTTASTYSIYATYTVDSNTSSVQLNGQVNVRGQVLIK